VNGITENLLCKNENFNVFVKRALFEALNPKQNSKFVDRYFDGLPVDLSKVLFILTSTDDLDMIQRIWKGRLGQLKNHVLEIEFSGYTLEEKLEIAKKHLIPKWQGKW